MKRSEIKGAFESDDARMLMLLICINFIVFFLFYSIFILNFHFSEDTFEAIMRIEALPEVNLRNGRFIHFFLYSLANDLGINLAGHQKAGQIVLTGVLAIGSAILTTRFERCQSSADHSWRKFLLIDAIVLLLFANPCFLFGWYAWPETAFGGALSLSVTFASILSICHPNPAKTQVISSAILLFISLGMYQVYVEFYVGVCIAYTLAQSGFHIDGKTLMRFAIILGIAFLMSILNIFMMRAMQQAGFIIRDGRSASSSIEIIIGNVISILKNQGRIWISLFDLLPSGYPVLLAAVLIGFAYAGSVTTGHRINIRDILLTTILLVGIIFVSFAPNIISSTLWLAPRTFAGLFTVYLVLGSLVLHTTLESKTLLTGAAITAVVFLVISGICILDAQANQLIANENDIQEIRIMEHEIIKYEETTGKTVDTVLYSYDAERSYFYPDVKYASFDDNLRGISCSWCFEYLFSFETDNGIRPTEMTIDDYAAIFGDSEWDSFDVAEQVQFKDGIAYIALY